MQTLYTTLCDRIGAIVPEIQVIDLDAGQLNRFCETSPVATPALLLKFSAPTIENIDASQDMVTVQITVRVVIDNSAGETSSTTPAQWRAKALDRLCVIDRVTAALRGFSTSEISSLERLSSVAEDRADCVFVQNITFAGSYIEVFE